MPVTLPTLTALPMIGLPKRCQRSIDSAPQRLRVGLKNVVSAGVDDMILDW